MTFEEYKQHFEKFSKIDTPEKLAICERQYKLYVQAMDNANYFAPVDMNKSLDKYKEELWDLFGLDQLTTEQTSILVVPSFTPEHLLLITQQPGATLLEHTHRDQMTYTHEKKTQNATLPPALSEKLSWLLNNVFTTARQPQGGHFTLDGTEYFITTTIEGKRHTIKQNSPTEGSRADKVIQVLELLITYTCTPTETILQQINTQIDILLEHY